MTSHEVIDSNDPLTEPQEFLKQIGANKAGYACHQPSLWLSYELLDRLFRL
ncbi:MAG: hypothetical protein ABW079_01860 [Sedimenticola sp.]